MGRADLILGMEPVESLRYLPYLSKEGTLITAMTPVLNIPDYPSIEKLYETIRSLPRAVMVHAAKLAREAGNLKTANMVLVGCAFHLLPIKLEAIEHFIEQVFAAKGQDVVDANFKAFRTGRRLTDESKSPSGV